MRTSFHPIFVALFSEESPSPTSFSVQCFKSLLSVSPGVSLGVIVGQNVDLEKLKLSLDSLLSPQTSIDYIPFFSENETTISPQMKLKSKAFASKYDPIVVMDTELYFVKDIIPSLKSFHESTKLIALTQSPLTHATLVKTVLQDPNTLRKLTSYLVVRSSLIISLFTNWENHWKELHQKPVLSNPLNPQESTTVPFDLLEQVSFNLALNKTLSIFDSTPNVQQQVVDHLPRTSFYVEKEVVHGLVGNGISQSSNRSLLNTPAMSVYSSASNESPRLPSSTKVSTTFVSNAITITHGLNEENEPDTPNVATTNRPLSVHSEIVRRYHDSPSVWTMGENVEREQREAEQRSQSPSLLHQPSLIRNQDQSNPQEPHKYGRIFFSDSPSPYMPSYPLVPLNHEGEFIAEQPVRLDDTHQTDINVSFSLNPAQHYVRQSDAKEKIHSSSSTSPSFHPHSDPKLIASPAPQQPSSRWSKGRTRRSLSTSEMEGSRRSDSVVHSSRFASSFENTKVQTFRIELPMVHRPEPPKPTEETDPILSSLSLTTSLTPNIRRITNAQNSPAVFPRPIRARSTDTELNLPAFTELDHSPFFRISNGRASSRILPNMEGASVTSSPFAQSLLVQTPRDSSTGLHPRFLSDSTVQIPFNLPQADQLPSLDDITDQMSTNTPNPLLTPVAPFSQVLQPSTQMETFEVPAKVMSPLQTPHNSIRADSRSDGSESSESCHFDWGSRGCANSLRSPIIQTFHSQTPSTQNSNPKIEGVFQKYHSPKEQIDLRSRRNSSHHGVSSPPGISNDLFERKIRRKANIFQEHQIEQPIRRQKDVRKHIESRGSRIRYLSPTQLALSHPASRSSSSCSVHSSPSSFISFHPLGDTTVLPLSNRQQQPVDLIANFGEQVSPFVFGNTSGLFPPLQGEERRQIEDGECGGHRLRTDENHNSSRANSNSSYYFDKSFSTENDFFLTRKSSSSSRMMVPTHHTQVFEPLLITQSTQSDRTIENSARPRWFHSPSHTQPEPSIRKALFTTPSPSPIPLRFDNLQPRVSPASNTESGTHLPFPAQPYFQPQQHSSRSCSPYNYSSVGSGSVLSVSNDRWFVPITPHSPISLSS